MKRKARERLEEATDILARELLNMATDPNVSESVRLSAIKDALDRGGVSAKTAVEVEVGPPKPYEAIFERVEAGFGELPTLCHIVNRLAAIKLGDTVDAGQARTCRMVRGSGASELKSSRMPHVDVAILRIIVASRGTKVVELQPMSLIRQDMQFRCQSRDLLGTFWAHSVSTEVNSGESQSMSFRC